MLAFPITRDSKFDISLLNKHIQEATMYVAQCKSENTNVLDVCGDRGDLYFLLTACLSTT